jgi:hypothetical protein
MHRAELEALAGAVQTDHLGIGVFEMTPLGLREVVQLVLGAPQAARGHRVQQGLPQMGARAIHQCDPRLACLAQGHAELRHQFEAGRAAAGDHDVMKARHLCRHAACPLRLMC